MNLLSKLPSLLLLFFLSDRINAWGKIGHASVAHIAQMRLTSRAQYHVTAILENSTMADVASWADQIKMFPEWSWSSTLHYIDILDGTQDYKKNRDCKNLNCVDGALQNYTKRLLNNATLTDLKFLIHFMGDIHQPLHCGYTKDRGGNEILVIMPYAKHATALHSVWDSYIIEYGIDTIYATREKWFNAILKSKELPHYDCSLDEYTSGACGEMIAENSFKIALNYAYNVQNMSRLDESYLNNGLEVINRQILSGGIMLSELLNLIFDD